MKTKATKKAAPKRARPAKKPVAVATATVSAADALTAVGEKIDGLRQALIPQPIIDTGIPTAGQLLERLRPAIKIIDSVLADCEAAGAGITEDGTMVGDFERLFVDLTLALVRAP